jgi:hypothetical protein
LVATTASFVSEASLSFTLLLTKVLNSGLLHLAADFFAAIKGYSLAIAGYGHLAVLLNHEEKQNLGSTYSSEETETGASCCIDEALDIPTPAEQLVSTQQH